MLTIIKKTISSEFNNLLTVMYLSKILKIVILEHIFYII